MSLIDAFSQKPAGQTSQPKPSGGSSLIDAFSQKPQVKENTQLAGGFALPKPEQWDYKTAKLGIHGEKLPEGALGWTPYGKPHFGNDFKGKMKELGYNLKYVFGGEDVTRNSSEQWDSLRQGWEDIKKQEEILKNQGFDEVRDREQFAETNRQEVGNLLGRVGTWWQDLSDRKDSPVGILARGVNKSVEGIGTLFSIPSQVVEQGMGAIQGFQDYANEVKSPLPKLDDNWFTKAIEDTPIGLAWDATRIALSPDNGNFEKVLERVNEGWNAGRIFYAGLFDETLKQEYIQRYRAGEDPELLELELSNRTVNVWGHEVNANIVELGGELIFDPLNFVGVFTKAGKLEQTISKAQEIGGLYKDKTALEALNVLEGSNDTSKISQSWNVIVEAQKSAVNNIRNGDLLKQSWTRKSLTVTSRENALLNTSSDFIGHSVGALMREGYSKEDFVEVLKYGIKSVSDDASEIQEGISALSKLPNAPRFLGDDANTTYITLRNLLSNESGKIDLSKLDNVFSKQSNYTQFVDEATDLLKQATKNQFATIEQMEDAVRLVDEAKKTGASVTKGTQELAELYKEVPSFARLASRVDVSIVGRTRKWINNTLGNFYFNLQGGVATRNILSNNILTSIDDGLKGWVSVEDVVTESGKISSRAKVWTQGAVDDNLTKWFGEFRPSATQGFGSKDVTKKPFLFGHISEWGESRAARWIANNATKDTMKKLLKLPAMGDTSILVKAGMNEADLNHLEKLFYAEKGNVLEIINSFRSYKSGEVGKETMDAWRSLDFLTSKDIDVLDDFGLMDELHDLTKTAKTPEDIEAFFDKLKQTVSEYANKATDDVAGMSKDNPALESWGRLSDAENDGYLPKGSSDVFATITEAAHNAQAEYIDTLQRTIDTLATSGRMNPQQSADFMNQKYQLFSPKDGVITKSGMETKRVSDELVNNAWYWTKEAKGKNADYSKMWKSVPLEGEPPIGLSRQDFLGQLWKETKNRQTEVWNGHFNRTFEESENLKDSLAPFIDSNALDSQFSRAKWATEQALAYRKVVSEQGKLVIKPTDNIRWMAKEYGIPTATAEGVSLDKSLLSIINKGQDEISATEKIVDIDKSTSIPRSELPEQVSERIAQEAKRLMSELSGGEAGGFSKGGERYGSSNVSWYKEAYKSGLRKPEIDKALEKIIMDRGRDKGVNVERMKEIIMDNFKYGDSASGTPPDLYILQQFGADKKTLQEALDNFNDITHQNLSLDEALKASGLPSIKTSKYSKIEDVPYEEARKALEKWRISNGKPEVKLKGFAVPPAHADGAMPSIGRMWNESKSGLDYMLDRTKNNILSQWGRRVSSPLTPDVDNALKTFMRDASPRIEEARIIASKVATEQRNFTLLNYGSKTYGDVAMSWVLPYHFWYSRQYKNWGTRMTTSPEVIAGYAKYKDRMEKINYDMPDFFKRNIDVSKLLGIKTDHPLFLNLEATVNPLYGLTGTDFNDPNKRVDWFSNMLDDVGKFGPSVWSPLQIANAIRLSMIGETDAAARWGGRIIPETKTIKEFLTNVTGQTGFNIGGAHIPFELDPAVWAFSGGLDPYERARVGRSLGALIGTTLPDGTVVTREMAIDAANSQEGALWEQAQVSANQIRGGAGGLNTISSYLLGVGFKPRTQEDVQIDQMYADMGQLVSMNKAGALTPEEYRQGWEQLSQQYEFFDTVLLSKRGGAERDTAYIYNVLGRIPPGDSGIFNDMGMQDLISKFYESKGDMSSWTKQDYERMTGFALDLGATYAMPDNATRQDWNLAKTEYRTVRDEIAKQLGDDIWDKISTYYDLKDTNEQLAIDFKKAHPEIDQANLMKQQAVIQNPKLFEYYGSLDLIEMYYSGSVRAQLIKKYGNDITDIQTEYFNRGIISKGAAREWLRQHPELKAYWSEKRVLELGMNQKIVHLAASLPDQADSVSLRSDFAPQNQTQSLLAENANRNAPEWSYFTELFSAPLTMRVEQYWSNGTPLNNASVKQLQYLANKNGYYDSDDLLRAAGYSFMKAQNQQPQMPVQPQGNLISAFQGQP